MGLNGFIGLIVDKYEDKVDQVLFQVACLLSFFEYCYLIHKEHIVKVEVFPRNNRRLHVVLFRSEVEENVLSILEHIFEDKKLILTNLVQKPPSEKVIFDWVFF